MKKATLQMVKKKILLGKKTPGEKESND